MSNQSTHASTESAVSRTPIEIWQHIIRQTVWWDRLPPETDPVASIAAFWRNCARYHRYIASMTIRAKLSLVCRSWYSVIQEIGDHLVITDLREHYWPSKEHLKRACSVEVSEDERLCRCDYNGIYDTNEWCGDLPEVMPIPGMRSSEAGIYPLQPEVLLLSHEHDAKHYVYSNPSSIRILAWSPILHNDLLSVIDSLTNLTHLNTYIAVEHIDRFKRDISLPNLQYLRLDFYLDGLSEAYIDPSAALQLGPTISRWTFPRLSTFAVGGTINGYIADEIKRLLSKSTKTLTALVSNSLGMIHETQYWPDCSLFWDIFPNLSLFGISIKWFSPHLMVPHSFSTISNCNRPMDVFINSPFNFADPYWDDEKTLTCARNLVYWCNSHPCGINRIVIHESWEKYASSLWHCHRLERYGPRARCARIFFNELIKWDIWVADCNGVDLRGEGRWFIDMWNSMCPPPSPEPIKAVVAEVEGDPQIEARNVGEELETSLE